MAKEAPIPKHNPTRLGSRLAITTLATAVLLVTIFAIMVLRFSAELREEIRDKIIGRDAAVLYPVALQRLAEAESLPGIPDDRNRLLNVLQSARQQGMLAIAVFDENGRTVEAVPATMLFVELPADDYIRLLAGAPLSRFHDAFPLDRHFADITPNRRTAPVLEVLLPLQIGDAGHLAGFARYYIDAKPLAHELNAIDERLESQTRATLLIGTGLIVIVLTLAYFALQRAQATVAERNAQLIRANFELTLAAKASALGQITSHLIHGLQGSVAGLRAMVVNHDSSPPTDEDWRSAAGYTERMQNLIQEAVGLLTDVEARATYSLSGDDLTEAIRRRCSEVAASKGVVLTVQHDFTETVDSHHGSLVCLIAANLVENAITATPLGRRVDVTIAADDGRLTLHVSDQGSGVTEPVKRRLFEPGNSSRQGGTGLGLAISRLLARQLGGELSLIRSDASGTCFRLWVPLEPARSREPASMS